MPPLTAILLAFMALASSLLAQAPGVPVYREERGSGTQAAIMKLAREWKDAGALLSIPQVTEQAKRSACELSLPAPSNQKLNSRELWARSRLAHLRIGWLYLCKNCNRWHINLSGGYAITNNTAVTCAHVLEPLDMREGYLFAADEADHVFPITEVLAASRALDSAILRVKTDTLTPLPFGRDIAPGDPVFCFSDPMGRRGFFSQGIVNRFVKRPFLRKRELKNLSQDTVAALPVPIWLETSTEWAPGSSGSALLDAFGNAVGHVSTIESVLEDPPTKARRTQSEERGTVMVIHGAIAAANVLSLIKPLAGASQ